MKAYSRSNCATSYLRGSSRAGCTARASPQIACIPVSSPHALPIKAAAWSRASFGSPSFSRYRLLRAQKQSSISRPRRTWPRRPDNTITNASRPRRRRGHRTTDRLCCCGNAARHWPARATANSASATRLIFRCSSSALSHAALDRYLRQIIQAARTPAAFRSERTPPEPASFLRQEGGGLVIILDRLTGPAARDRHFLFQGHENRGNIARSHSQKDSGAGVRRYAKRQSARSPKKGRSESWKQHLGPSIGGLAESNYTGLGITMVF
jgi:hypothetical protein